MASTQSVEPTREEADRPFVSVIVPVYNDPAGLTATLSSLVQQTYPSDRHEVLVVDNGSTDCTDAVARRFSSDFEFVHTVFESVGGSYAARNAGIDAAEGSIFAFVDADMTADPEWLASAVDRLEETGAMYMGCDVELAEADGRPGLAERYNRRTAFPIRQYVEDWQFAPTCCLVVRREVIDEVGDFDARMLSGGDREFGNRVAEAGYELVFADGVTLTHPPRTSLRSLLRKSVRVGRGSYQLRRYHPERYGHPVAFLANPFGYTPPRLTSLRYRIRGWCDLPVRDKLLFALVSWLLTLGNAYGRLRQLLHVDPGATGLTAPGDGTAE